MVLSTRKLTLKSLNESLRGCGLSEKGGPWSLQIRSVPKQGVEVKLVCGDNSNPRAVHNSCSHVIVNVLDYIT